MNNTWIYIFIMAIVTYIIRVLPLTLIRRRIKNRFIRSFLYYVPYVTLSVMTFPAIIYVTKFKLAGAISLIVGIILAWNKKSLFTVAVFSCVSVLVTEFVLNMI